MDFFMENAQLRPDLRDRYPRGVSTLTLIRDGIRTGTTRSFALGRVGELVVLHSARDPTDKEVVVRIVGTEKLSIRTREQMEAWSAKEGWSIEHLQSSPHLWSEWQTSFELV